MNPLTNVKNINKINEIELLRGTVNKKTSWHEMYSESAWIFIGGLSYGMTEGDVIAVFSQYGELVNINMVRDKKTGKIKGFCFLCYSNQKSTVLAVDNFNGIKLCGRTIRVDHVANYKPPKENEEDDDVTKMLKSEGCAPQKIKVEPPSSEEELYKRHKKFKTEKLEKSSRKVKIKKESRWCNDDGALAEIAVEKSRDKHKQHREDSDSDFNIPRSKKESSRDGNLDRQSRSPTKARYQDETYSKHFHSDNDNLQRSSIGKIPRSDHLDERRQLRTESSGCPEMSEYREESSSNRKDYVYSKDDRTETSHSKDFRRTFKSSRGFISDSDEEVPRKKEKLSQSNDFYRDRQSEDHYMKEKSNYDDKSSKDFNSKALKRASKSSKGFNSNSDEKVPRREILPPIDDFYRVRQQNKDRYSKEKSKYDDKSSFDRKYDTHSKSKNHDSYCKDSSSRVCDPHSNDLSSDDENYDARHTQRMQKVFRGRNDLSSDNEYEHVKISKSKKKDSRDFFSKTEKVKVNSKSKKKSKSQDSDSNGSRIEKQKHYNARKSPKDRKNLQQQSSTSDSDSGSDDPKTETQKPKVVREKNIHSKRENKDNVNSKAKKTKTKSQDKRSLSSESDSDDLRTEKRKQRDSKITKDNDFASRTKADFELQESLSSSDSDSDNSKVEKRKLKNTDIKKYKIDTKLRDGGHKHSGKSKDKYSASSSKYDQYQNKEGHGRTDSSKDDNYHNDK